MILTHSLIKGVYLIYLSFNLPLSKQIQLRPDIVIYHTNFLPHYQVIVYFIFIYCIYIYFIINYNYLFNYINGYLYFFINYHCVNLTLKEILFKYFYFNLTVLLIINLFFNYCEWIVVFNNCNQIFSFAYTVIYAYGIF